MIDLCTIAGLYENDYELHAYCATCDRWATQGQVRVELLVQPRGSSLSAM